MKYDIDGHVWWAPAKKLGGGWICHKDSPAPPAAPDPYQTAGAQTQSNQQTANYNAGLNRVNTNTPWGSLTYTHTPSTPAQPAATQPSFDQAGYDKAMQQYQTAQNQATNGYNPAGSYNGEAGGSTIGTTAGPAMPSKNDFMTGAGVPIAGQTPAAPDQWTQNVTLSPEQQQLLDLQNQSSIKMGQTGLNQLNQVSNALSKPVNFDGSPSQVTNVQAGGLQNHAQYGHIQDDVSMAGVPKLVGGNQLYGAMNDAQNAAYKQAASRLDPQWANSNHDLENQLVQQGVMQNSDAWNRAMSQQSRDQTDAYQTAQNNSVQQGNAAQAQLFGQGLASNQNAYGQNLSNANFHNSAQGQGFGQSYANAQLANAAQAQQFGQGMQNAQLQNQGRQQNISEIMQQRQEPLNELSALRNGSQVTAPTFPGVPGSNMAGTDVGGMIGQNYNALMGQNNAQTASANATNSGLMSLAATAAMAFSDRRLKRNIERIGTYRGIGVYKYDYVWGEPSVGLMADEVETIAPHAVGEYGGFKTVDYSKV